MSTTGPAEVAFLAKVREVYPSLQGKPDNTIVFMGRQVCGLMGGGSGVVGAHDMMVSAGFSDEQSSVQVLAAADTLCPQYRPAS